MEGQDFLTEYKTISNKLKKRFLRRPNVAEASDNYRQLAKRLQDNDENQFAGFCFLATGRCEQTVGNGAAEVESISAAARCFLAAELQVQDLNNPSFHQLLNAAIASFKQAGKLQEEAGRSSAAAAIYVKLGNELLALSRPAEALFYYEKAKALQVNSIVDFICINNKIAGCYISLGDHHNALKVLTTLASFTADNDPCQLYHAQTAAIEILRVFLLLIIQPSHHNTAPHLLKVLTKYKWESGEPGLSPATPGSEDDGLGGPLDQDLAILLQSIVMAVQVCDTEALLCLEDEIVEHLDHTQKRLLRIIVSREMRRN